LALLQLGGRAGGSRRLGRRALLILPWSGIALAVGALVAPLGAADDVGFGDLSLEDLLAVQVTTVSKRPETLVDAAASIFVLTAEEIRRSGATTVPDALRLVPGLHVARTGTNTWVINARGFADAFSSKVLVMIDGRSVYSHLFAGTHWDAQALPLEEVARIEVIRGPGATLWGANAVNGIINIITKHSDETRGGLLAGGSGNAEQGFGVARYGATAGTQATWRAYGRYFNRDGRTAPGDAHGVENWRGWSAGFRLDHELPHGALTLLGSAYQSRSSERLTLIDLTFPYAHTGSHERNVTGGNLLVRRSQELGTAGEVSVQFSFDHMEREEGYANTDYTRVDLDLQHWLPLGSRHLFQWGVGYRADADETEDTFMLSVDPPRRTEQLFSGLVRDEFEVVRDRLYVIAGTKVQHNEAVGWEWQPSLRLRWRPATDQMLWAAAAQAVRTPTRGERDFRLNVAVIPDSNGTPTVLSILGDEDPQSETLVALECGYRRSWGERATLDLVAFRNAYRHLLGGVSGGAPYWETEPAPAHFVVPVRVDFAHDGTTRGIELGASLRPAAALNVRGSYTYLQSDLEVTPFEATRGLNMRENHPRHQVALRLALTPAPRWECDLFVAHTGEFVNESVAAHTRVDLRLAWRPLGGLWLEVVGQDLAQEEHVEYEQAWIGEAVAVERSVYGKATWRF